MRNGRRILKKVYNRVPLVEELTWATNGLSLAEAQKEEGKDKHLLGGQPAKAGTTSVRLIVVPISERLCGNEHLPLLLTQPPSCESRDLGLALLSKTSFMHGVHPPVYSFVRATGENLEMKLTLLASFEVSLSLPWKVGNWSLEGTSLPVVARFHQPPLASTSGHLPLQATSGDHRQRRNIF